MVLGSLGSWLDSTGGSANRLNGMTRISGTGTELAVLTPSVYRFVYCTSTGSGFTAGHNYKTNVTGDAYVDEDATAAGGTAYVLTLALNSMLIDTADHFVFDVKVAKWVASNTSTGTTVDDTDGTTGEQSIKLGTGVTSGSRAQITQVGLKQDFSKPSFLSSKVRIGTLLNLNLRGGVNCDAVTSVDSNNPNYAWEVCTATNNNWFIRSADGTATSASNTAIAATTNRTGLKLEHYPTIGTPAVLLYVGVAAAVQKTSNIPATADVGANNDVIRFTIKNSTTADRPLYMYGCRMAYYVSDSWA